MGELGTGGGGGFCHTRFKSSWKIFNKFGTIFLILFLSKSILLSVKVCKIAG